jgi:hypothetical protein
MSNSWFDITIKAIGLGLEAQNVFAHRLTRAMSGDGNGVAAVDPLLSENVDHRSPSIEKGTKRTRAVRASKVASKKTKARRRKK